MENTLYYGDNLPILREHLADESVDLIYLDPPFNSNRSYNVLFKEATGRESDAQIVAFDDTWTWGPTSAATLLELPERASHRVVKMINALVDALGHNEVTAYLVMMTARLVELHRVLKPTGSLYLHCDPTASHYLKVVLDAIFDPRNFRNEIVWQRTSSHNDTKRWGAVHDIVLFYSKSDSFVWNPVYLAHDPEYISNFYRHTDERGTYRLDHIIRSKSMGPRPNLAYEYKGYTPQWGWRVVREKLEALDADNRLEWSISGRPYLKRYLHEQKGTPVKSVITDIGPIGAQAAERLGYPTQKPLALLERIVNASSNPGDVVLDPFCGCGTAIHAAQKLGRTWIGIDVSHLAIALIKYRLASAFPGIQYQIIGEPRDVSAAHQLAHDDRYQFQWWALSLAKARPYQDRKKGADTGIDGLIYFNDTPLALSGRGAGGEGQTKTIIVQVKSGKVDVRTVRELTAVVDREKATMGLLITLHDPTQPMEAEAIGAGLYTSPVGIKYLKIQILTVTKLLQGEQPKYPYGTASTFKQAQREQSSAINLPLPMGDRKDQ